MYDENDTRYVKTSRKVTPPKADHKHEYVRAVTYMYIRRFDGSVTEDKHRFTAPDVCVECGHRSRSRTEAVEVEVSPAEYLKIKNNR